MVKSTQSTPSRLRLWVSLNLLLLARVVFGQYETPWARLSPAFTPPAEFLNQFGGYRTPLLFSDGARANSAADWAKRREELLQQWHNLMGSWPPLLPQPKFEVMKESKRENFYQRRVRLEIASGRMEEGWLLVPASAERLPAVLVPFYEPETSIGLGQSEFRDFGYQLARRGFVTLSIGSPGGDARRPDPRRPGWQPLSFLAYVAANAHRTLAGLPEVDPARIGVVGHSYGGKWAMFAACLYQPFACAAWSDPGIVFDETRPNVNYWEPWYLGFDPSREQQRKPGVPVDTNPRTGAYKIMCETERDLHELHALMAPRPFLVSGGSEDPPSRWTALNHTVAVNALLGFTNRVAMTNRKEHSPNAESNEQIYLFFENFLKNRTSER